MKVVAFNGSAHKEGNTAIGLQIVLDQLTNEGIETEMIHVGGTQIKGCVACQHCMKARNQECGLPDDPVNGWIQKMIEADGILFGSPVHFSSIGANLKSFLDRAFYVSTANGNLFRHKVGASVVAVRRSGGLPTFNELNNYMNYSEMILPSSNYWNVIHGTRPGDAKQDTEGAQIMRILGKNMAWIMKLKEFGQNGVPAPEKEKKEYMGFIH